LAEKDIAEKNFIALNDVFADIFNALLFHGKQIIIADSLEDLSPTSQYRADDSKLHEQERDTHKLWRGHGINLVLLGIENQTQPDKDMPFRVFNYDGASYRSQLLKTEEKMIDGELKQVPSKERYPVITIVLYFGKELWNYPKNLCDSFYPALSDDDVTRVLKEYIQDYKIHVFDIPRLTQEEVKLFRSDFRIVADYFVHAYTDYDYIPDDAVITHVDEFLKLMNVLTGDDRYSELSLSFTKTEKEVGLRMCNVLDAREARGEARGLQQGLEQGRAEALIALVDTVKNFTNDKEEIYQAVIKNEAYKNTPREEVFKYLK